MRTKYPRQITGIITCTNCEKELSPNYFGTDTRKINGLKSICRMCDSRLHAPKPVYSDNAIEYLSRVFNNYD